MKKQERIGISMGSDAFHPGEGYQTFHITLCYLQISGNRLTQPSIFISDPLVIFSEKGGQRCLSHFLKNENNNGKIKLLPRKIVVFRLQHGASKMKSPIMSFTIGRKNFFLNQPSPAPHSLKSLLKREIVVQKPSIPE